MRKDLLEALYLGHISPSDECVSDSETNKLNHRLAKAEDILLASLKGEDRKHFQEYVDLTVFLLGRIETERFVSGFRLGARLQLEILLSD